MNRLQRSIVVLGVTCATPSLLFIVPAEAQDAPPPQVITVQTTVVVDQVEVKKGDEKKAEGGKQGKKEDNFVADLTGIQTRLIEVPLPAGNYNSLSLDDKEVLWSRIKSSVD